MVLVYGLKLFFPSFVTDVNDLPIARIDTEITLSWAIWLIGRKKGRISSDPVIEKARLDKWDRVLFLTVDLFPKQEKEISKCVGVDSIFRSLQ